MDNLETKNTNIPADEKNDEKSPETGFEKNIPNPIWLLISEAAKLGGVQQKTIRRAILAKTVKYKIVKNRYLVELSSVVKYLDSNTKLKNKFNNFGLGQYFISPKS
jgi:hypothetical protein